MAIFSRSTSKRPSGKHYSSSRAYLKRRTRFAPVCDGLEVRALLSNIVVTNNDDSGAGSLRQAIALAQTGASISFAKSLRGETIKLSSGPLVLNQNVSIEGLGASELSVSGGGASAVFNVASGVNATISGLTITDGMNNAGYSGFAYGGGIVNMGELALENVVVSGNQAIGIRAEGGGIYNTGNLTLSYSLVTGNEANSEETTGSGGGIENAAGGTLTVTHSVVSKNEVTSLSSPSITGGGIDNQSGGTATVIDSTITGNAALGGPGFFEGTWAYGGAISDEGALTISGSTFSDNQADGGSNGSVAGFGFGGAISLPSPTSSTGPGFATLTMTSSVLYGNQANGGNSAGTGFFSEGGDADGGALEAFTGSSVTLAGCTFSNNQALGGAGGSGEAFGGAIYSNGSLALSISGSTFANNEAEGGAGLSGFRASFISRHFQVQTQTVVRSAVLKIRSSSPAAHSRTTKPSAAMRSSPAIAAQAGWPPAERSITNPTRLR